MSSGDPLEIKLGDVFARSGFYTIWTRGKEFKFNGDNDSIQIDIICIWKNICVFIEATSESGDSGTKIDRFSSQCAKALTDNRLIEYLEFLKTLDGFEIDVSKFKVPNIKYRELFVGTNTELEILRTRGDNATPKIYTWDKDLFEYFELLSESIQEFSRYEFLGFLDIAPDMIEGEPPDAKNIEAIKLVSSEVHHEVYTFSILVKDLLEMGKIMRRDGWESESFQRFVKDSKLNKIRTYLLQEGSFFPNNIIVALPQDTSFVPMSKENERVGTLVIPRRYGSIIVIDGQHRLLGYTKCNMSRNSRAKGSELRQLQEEDAKIRGYLESHRLIVTGIKFSSPDESKDRARIFVEINDNQTRIKKELIYILAWQILGSKYPEAVASCILERLGDENILLDKFQEKEFQKNRIPITSIIRYALRYLVDIRNGELYRIAPKWIQQACDEENYEPFIKHCVTLLEQYFRQIKSVFSPGEDADSPWNDTTKERSMLMSVTSLASFFRLFRHFFYTDGVWRKGSFFESRKVQEGDTLKTRVFLKMERTKEVLEALSAISFKKDGFMYSPSQWGKLEAFMISEIRKKRKHKKFGKTPLLSTTYITVFKLI